MAATGGRAEGGRVREAIEVMQGVRVFAVACVGEELRVDLYGGGDCACGTLTYRFADRRERQVRAALVRRWRDRGTPLTYVSRGGTATLMDERAVLADALGP